MPLLNLAPHYIYTSPPFEWGSTQETLQASGQVKTSDPGQTIEKNKNRGMRERES